MNVDVTSLRNLDEVRAAFQTLTSEEEKVNLELEQLLAKQAALELNLKSAVTSTSSLKTVKSDMADKLMSTIGHTAKLADGVSAKVKQLDTAKSRVNECQSRVNDLIDLKLCSDGVKSALLDEDYEQAAAHLHRFLSMDLEAVVTTATNDLASQEDNVNDLKSALVTVNQVVGDRFDESVESEDLASIERFFKIFPLIDQHEDGLNKFTAYLCAKLSAAGKVNLSEAVNTPKSDPRGNVIYADTLTLLFEGVARTIEIHQPLIETYYGPGRLLTVMRMLQKECDAQTSHILTEFRRKRNIADIKAKINANEASVQAKDLDHVLSEMILLEARAEMYCKFVRKRVGADLEVSGNDETGLTSLDQLLNNSKLCHLMQDLLADYILFEQYFMSKNIGKAISDQESVVDEETMLDDVFFLVKKSVLRSIKGHNVDGVCAVVNNACAVLESEFCSVIQANLKMGFPWGGYLDNLTNAYNVLHSSYQQGKLQTDSADKQKILFLTSLNHADKAGDYVQRLTASLTSEVQVMVRSRSENERQKLDTCLQGFQGVVAKLKAVLEQGMQQLRQSAIKPRIKPWVDGFVSHDIGENDFADFEANDPFIQHLILNLDGLLRGFKASLSGNNYDALVSLLTTETTLQLEKAVFKSKFSRLGGLLLDREIRSLVSFLTNVTTWSVREKFARLSQIATVLNLESVSEMQEISTPSISHGEIRQVLSLRTDFKPEDIKRVRL